MTEDAQRLAGEILTEPIERDGLFWRKPGYTAVLENWNEMATDNEIFAAIAAKDEAVEATKSRPDVDFIMTQIAPGMRVLDVGCGYGRLAKYLLPRMGLGAYIGLDSSRVMLQKFWTRYASRAEERGTPLVLVNADIDRLPLREGSVDLCIVSAVFLHNHKDVTRASVAEIRRVLKPGGRLLVIGSFLNARSLTGLQGWAFLQYLNLIGQGRKNGPVRYFSRDEVTGLLKDFGTVKIHSRGFSLYPKTLLGLPGPLRWPYRRAYDIIHAFLKPRAPEWLQRRFCVHLDVVADKAGMAEAS